MQNSKLGFHFQPLQDQEITQTDNAPLLFNANPPGRQGRVTLFLRTRRTLRRRLGVHDLGQIESVLQDPDREVGHDQMKHALGKMTQWRYLFPPETGTEPNPDARRGEQDLFSDLVDRALAG